MRIVDKGGHRLGRADADPGDSPQDGDGPLPGEGDVGSAEARDGLGGGPGRGRWAEWACQDCC
jgi:hypothetical protein